MPISKKTSEDKLFSIVIPVRNEEKTIEKLLTCLEYQEYDKNKYEVIVVDDFSEDNTYDYITSLKNQFEMDLKTVALDNVRASGKKRAITLGVETAKYDFIITTDADCQMGPLWLASYATMAEKSKFIAAPVVLKGDGLFSRLQQSEFSGLIGFGAVTMTNGSPSMCSGANLGFDKSAFFEVGGYADNLNIPSGDDEFLQYHVYQKHPDKVSFLKSKSAIVVTSTHTLFSKFINQRIRWTSKWKYHKNFKLRVTAVLFFCDHLLFLGGLGLTLAGNLPVYIVPLILVLRWIASCIYLFPIQKFLGLLTNGWSLLLLQIIYPFHVLFMGLNSIFGRYTWKGRNY